MLVNSTLAKQLVRMDTRIHSGKIHPSPSKIAECIYRSGYADTAIQGEPHVHNKYPSAISTIGNL